MKLSLVVRLKMVDTTTMRPDIPLKQVLFILFIFILFRKNTGNCIL